MVQESVGEATERAAVQVTETVNERADQMESSLAAVSTAVEEVPQQVLEGTRGALEEWFGPAPSDGQSTDVQIMNTEANIQRLRAQSLAARVCLRLLAFAFAEFAFALAAFAV